MKWLRIGSAGLLLFAFTACESLNDLGELDVTNQNDPDTERALAAAGDIESLIGGAFAVWHLGTTGHNGDPSMALSTTADELTVSWGNFGGQQLSSEPRVAWPNGSSWRYSHMSEHPWYESYAAISAVYDGLRAIADDDGTLAAAFDIDRARAIAKFVQGLGHGWLALMYDSAFILTEDVDLATDELELSPYPDVMAVALGAFDEAISIANGGIGDMESSWFSGNPFTAAEFVQLVNSHYARQAAPMARTPAERAAANWHEIYSRADAGITADLMFDGDGGVIWFNGAMWWGDEPDNSWGRADYKTIGWTEVSVGTESMGASGYAAWLATPVAQRTEFELDVFDRRIHPAGDPQGMGTDFQYYGPSPFRSARGTYHFSLYKHYRYADWVNSNAFDPWVYMKSTEMDMLKAEAALRGGAGGGVGEAVTLINATRVGRGSLPPVDAGMSTQDLLDAMAYEKLIENFVVCSGCPYFDRRGWGDLAPTGPNHHQGLVEGSPLHFAPPGLELETLQKLVYTYGGVGNEGGALAPMAASGPRGSLSVTRVPASHVYQFKGLETTREKLEYMRGNRSLPVGAGSLTRH